MKKLFLLFALSIVTVSVSQNKHTITGKIVDDNKKIALESATIYLKKIKDSSIVEYTISDKNGNFKLGSPKIDEPISIKISMVGYEDFKEDLPKITADKHLGTLFLKEAPKSLEAVVVKRETPPVRIKKDTLEFNAASFKLRPDANVEALIKQLPGVEIDSEGKITVNGKEVNQILVNGKPFFGSDGKIALQNLPSNIINKVQVTDTKSKKEEKTGAQASSNNASINLTIDEKKNKGLFGKAMVGYGSSKRYESSGLINYFKNKTKVSVLASSNNINSIGFSMDEIFDNMGGGRNMSYWSNSDGSFGINGRRYGNGTGITQSNLVGANYSDEFGKKLELSGSYYHNSAHTKNTNRTNQINFLPTGTFETNSGEVSNNDNFANSLNTMVEIKPDSLTSIVIQPKISKSLNKLRNNSFQKSYDENGLVNESISSNITDTDKINFENEFVFSKSSRKCKGRYFSATWNTEFQDENEDKFTNSNTVFYQNTTPADIRNQYLKSKYKQNSNTFEVEFQEPIADSVTIKFGNSLRLSQTNSSRNANDFDTTTQDYTAENAPLSNVLNSNNKSINPFAGFVINKNKINLTFKAGTEIFHYNAFSNYLNIDTNLTRNYIYPSANIYGNIKFSKSKNLWINYSYDVNMPSASQILPVEDISNPLNTTIGNENLNPSKTHFVSLSYRNYDFNTKTGYGIYTGGNFNDDRIVSVSTYDANRKRTTTYTNVSGVFNSWTGIYWNKTFKTDKAKYRLNLRTNGNYSENKGFTNGVMYSSQTITLSPRINFNYELGEKLIINPSYNYSKNFVSYTNYVIDKTSYFTHNFNIQVTNYLPKNFTLGNDFGYNYNSNISDGYRKDFYLWNTSLSYSFYNKQLTAKVKVYDILNQNQSNSRQASATSITDSENTVLKRYVMFSLAYKLEKFAGKEKKSRSFMMW